MPLFANKHSVSFDNHFVHEKVDEAAVLSSFGVGGGAAGGGFC
jgi:hypothetical protein